MKSIVIGSRGSRLAMWQARHVEAEIRKRRADVAVSIEVIKTTGDKLAETALARIGGKGVFVKEIEEALLDRRIDLAVHSLKDVPTELPEGLRLGAVLPREDPRDALAAHKKLDDLELLPRKARVGTGSLRRSVQLRSLRPDLEVAPIRGNVDTRLRKLEEENLNGVVLAAAGLKRLGFSDRMAYLFAVDEMTPAIGQGALAVELRSDDPEVERIVETLNDGDSQQCVEQERKFLNCMGGGCQVPMGALAELRNGDASFTAFVAGPVSGKLVRKTARGRRRRIAELRRQVTDYLIEQGAEEMLGELD